MRKQLRTLLTFVMVSICTAQSAWADDVVANVTLKENNSLDTEILALSHIDDLKTVTHLTVTTNEGIMLGEEDWDTMKSMEALKVLDLSNASADALPANAFYSCCPDLETVKLPKNLTTIGDQAFTGRTNLVTVVVPNTVTTIGRYAFQNCKLLENCDISACQIASIPDGCFYQCNQLKSFAIPSSVTSIGGQAFYNCNNFTSSLPENVEIIGYSAFRSAAMTDMDIVLAEGVEIGNGAFEYSGIKSIDLPTTRYNSYSMVNYCSNLQTVTLRSPTMINVTSAISNASNITLRVPSHLIASYKSDQWWSKCKDVVAISPAITDYQVNQTLDLRNSSIRMEGTPNVTFSPEASLTISGSTSQNFNNFTASANISGNRSYTMILNESANVSVNGLFKQRFYIRGGFWQFLCLPFDFVVGDIAIESGSFVIRTYDGTRRNTEDVSTGNWSDNLAADAEIKAGTGFIVQTSDNYTWITFKAKTGGTNHAFKKESDMIVTPLAANNSNNAASTANTGWNMVGNPWQTYYNIHNMNYTAPFAVYSPNNRIYNTYSPQDDDYALKPFEALFVQCPNGVTGIEFPANGRQLTSEVTSQNPARLRAASQRRLFDLQVSNGELSDKTRLVVNTDASLDYEIERDASKFFDNGSATPQIYTLDADGTQYAINERPADSGTVNLGIVFATDGEYTLSAVRNNIGEVVLTDNETGIKTDLQQHSYTFDAQAGVNNARFSLSFVSAATGISSLKSNEANVKEVYTLNGIKVGNTTDGLQKGIYMVRQGQQTQKVIIK